MMVNKSKRALNLPQDMQRLAELAHIPPCCTFRTYSRKFLDTESQAGSQCRIHRPSRERSK
jgi:hypothetical protein